MGIKYVDFVNGNDGNSGDSFAQAWKTLTFTAGTTEVRVKKTPDPVSLGVNGSWIKYDKTLVLSSALNTTIHSCDSGWTAAANVVLTYSTPSKQGAAYINIATQAGFTTGLVAYKAVTNLDLSAYQQLCFWVNMGTIPQSMWEIKLCSDSAGAVPVATIAIPSSKISVAGNWHPITVDFGSALPSGVNSVAVYANASAPSKVLRLDNIFAAKAPGTAGCLTLQTLIGKNDGEWWAVQSVNGTTVAFDQLKTDDVNAVKGFYGTTETAAVWRRDCYAPPVPATSNTATVIGLSASYTGTTSTATYFQVSGGWSDETTQDGYTAIDCQNWNGRGIYGGTTEAFQLSKFIVVRAYNGFEGFVFSRASDCMAIACQNYGFITASTQKAHFTDCTAIACNNGFSVAYSPTLIRCKSYSSTIAPFTCSYAGTFESCLFANSASQGIPGKDSHFKNTAFINTQGGYQDMAPATGDTVYCDWCTTDSLSLGFPVASESTTGGGVFATNLNGRGNAHWWGAVAEWYTDSSTRHTASGYSWCVMFSGIKGYNPLTPLRMRVALVNCKSGVSTTVKAWLMRDNVLAAAQLAIRGGQIAGVTNTVTDSLTASINTWQEVTITFTPAEDGLVEIEMLSYGGAVGARVWVDDIAVS